MLHTVLMGIADRANALPDGESTCISRSGRINNDSRWIITGAQRWLDLFCMHCTLAGDLNND